MNLKNYSTKEVAELLSYNEEVVRRKIRAGEIKAVKFGKKWLIPETEIKKIMEVE